MYIRGLITRNFAELTEAVPTGGGCGGSVLDPCFVLQYLVSYLVLQASW